MKEGWAAANAVIQLIMMSYLLKVRGHEMNIFFKAAKIRSVLSLHAKMVFKFIGCLL
jgi:hypothetical protein